MTNHRNPTVLAKPTALAPAAGAQPQDRQLAVTQTTDVDGCDRALTILIQCDTKCAVRSGWSAALRRRGSSKKAADESVAMDMCKCLISVQKTLTTRGREHGREHGESADRTDVPVLRRSCGLHQCVSNRHAARRVGARTRARIALPLSQLSQ